MQGGFEFHVLSCICCGIYRYRSLHMYGSIVGEEKKKKGHGTVGNGSLYASYIKVNKKNSPFADGHHTREV